MDIKKPCVRPAKSSDSHMNAVQSRHHTRQYFSVHIGLNNETNENIDRL
jgi:hypothetical protein